MSPCIWASLRSNNMETAPIEDKTLGIDGSSGWSLTNCKENLKFSEEMVILTKIH